MLRRLIDWWARTREGRPADPEPEMTDVAQALAPYRDEPPLRLLRLADPVRD
jgi:hypothetical protein